ncbi:MAG: TetR-like C-terminal domain-containing protein [Pseudomonadota bacterium]
MSSSDQTERRGYHHGNLREALVAATLPLIEDKGPQGFTLSEAAKAAGVSAAAPYRHFKGREDLLAEVARQGYHLFAERMEAAWQRYESTPLRAFEAVGRAYIEFARDNPGHYVAMFESGISVAGNAQLNDAAQRAMAVLTRAAARLSAHLPADRRPPASMVSHHIWALSHGVVTLFARGAPGRRAPFSPEDLLESGTMIYLRGLGLLPGDE